MKHSEIIHCPKCKGNLSSIDSQGSSGESGSYFCQTCGIKYPVIDSVVEFLPGGMVTKGLGQKLMESPRMVSIYESKWWRGCKQFSWFMGLTLDEEIELIKRITYPGEKDTVLDLACGTGIYARAFAQGSPGRNVFGLDISWPMLQYAADKARSMGIDNVRFLHGDAHSLPFADESLDVANCCGALHLFSDVRRVLGELYRTIKPGGRFSVAAAWKSDNLWGRIKAYSDEKFWKIHYFRKDELSSLLDEAGFTPTIYHAYGIWMVAGGVRR
ncbi:hypothetical protein CUJ83_08825 [Methanocella sp. CWC-04]|uniref:Methyltransferase domain-containing protein n=1 Tax=Methanooceanicella nereidis TaxID=2052831 RepID=A0AAP2RCM4_9EURY|nr:class I SAM-dependent methyltransferase [Methanocella sp. CWC-04]MCD1295099.1 hypothetical protein [Methanocella sp. CWC-04]